jgi:hypothetical protein
MNKIGVALSIPELDKTINKYRQKYDKYKHLEAHMTIYLSDYTGFNNVLNLAKILEKYNRKVLINNVAKKGKITYLNVQNWKDFTELKKECVKTFGEEKYKSNFHITIGYNIPNNEYDIMKKELSNVLPLEVEGSAYKIVLMKPDDAKEYYINPK